MTVRKINNKVNLTADRVESFKCERGKVQSFLWCSKVAGLGVRATKKSKEKRYIFQAKINKKTMRLTIGKVSVWSIPMAQEEARKLQVQIDNGFDPRVVKLEKLLEQAELAVEKKRQEVREAVTVKMAWDEYLAEREPHWSKLHYRDHVVSMKQGGEKRLRSNREFTEPGVLAIFSPIRLVDMTSDLVDDWSKREGIKRPTRARLALRLLKAFLSWCMRHPIYKEIIKENVAYSAKARERLGKPKPKNDVLQREQLKPWFDAVKRLRNPVVQAYLQTLLLIGSRREELISLCWKDVDFRWRSITIHDKVDGLRVIPLTPYVSYLLSTLPRRNQWVFSSPSSKKGKGRLTDPRMSHNRACAVAGLNLTLHGLRRSFASLCEWTETPAGVAAQIQGHKPQGVREQNYIRRPLDLLRVWHTKYEEWILNEAGIEFVAEQPALKVVATA